MRRLFFAALVLFVFVSSTSAEGPGSVRLAPEGADEAGPGEIRQEEAGLVVETPPHDDRLYLQELLDQLPEIDAQIIRGARRAHP